MNITSKLAATGIAAMLLSGAGTAVAGAAEARTPDRDRKAEFCAAFAERRSTPEENAAAVQERFAAIRERLGERLATAQEKGYTATASVIEQRLERLDQWEAKYPAKAEEIAVKVEARCAER